MVQVRARRNELLSQHVYGNLSNFSFEIFGINIYSYAPYKDLGAR
jgi:hypothetical protein